MRERVLRRLGDWIVWCSLLAVGFLVGHWWSANGDELVRRLAAWSTPAPGPDPPIARAKLGPRKQAMFDRMEKARDAAEKARDAR